MNVSIAFRPKRVDALLAAIELALARAREILGLPPAPSSDPLHEEKKKIEAARRELPGARERASEVPGAPAAWPASSERGPHAGRDAGAPKV